MGEKGKIRGFIIVDDNGIDQSSLHYGLLRCRNEAIEVLGEIVSGLPDDDAEEFASRCRFIEVEIDEEESDEE
jgi:hypothetical protein